jgi:hypothetical protein
MVEFETSVDAFDNLVAAFNARYGGAVQEVRDVIIDRSHIRLPRVQMTWKRYGQSIRITDPAGRPNLLMVQFEAGNGVQRPAS